MPKTTPMRAIRAKCVECAGGRRAVTGCPTEACPLHVYRMGRNPARAGLGPPMDPEAAKRLRDARRNPISASEGTAQVVTSEGNGANPQSHTPELATGHPRAKKGEAALDAMNARKRRRIIKAAEAFMREIQEG